jgi:hypothetical protein
MKKSLKKSIELMSSYLSKLRCCSDALASLDASSDGLVAQLDTLSQLVKEMSLCRDIQQHDAVHRWLDKVNACIESVRKYDSTRDALCEQLGYLDDEFEIAIFRMQAELRDKADMAKKLFQFLAMNADKLTQIEGFEDLFDAADDSCVEMVSPPESENSSTAGQECSLFD